MPLGFLVCLAIFGLVISLFASISVKAMQKLAWHELQKYCQRRELNRLFEEIHAKEDDAVLAIEFTQVIGLLIFAVCSTGWYVEYKNLPTLSLRDLTVVLVFDSLVAFCVTLWIPREFAVWFGPSYLVMTWFIWRLVIILLTPFGWASNGLRKLSYRAFGGNEDAKAKEKELEDEIRSIVVEGQHDKSLDPKLREMIEGVIELDDLTARDIMQHKSEINAVSIDDNWQAVLRQVIECGRTRIPVYESNLDNIVGTLYVKDLLDDLTSKRELHNVREIIRDACKIPETMGSHELLKMFLTEKKHQAIVIDEFNTTLGLVTIEDILELIVGEIVDEDEAEESEEHSIETLSDGCYLVAADAHLDDINEEIDTDIPSGDDYNTLGGFLIVNLHDIPKTGTEFKWQGLRFKVEEATKRQVKSVRIEVPVSTNGRTKASANAIE